MLASPASANIDSMPDSVISVCNLGKRYGSTVAVEDVSFTVERGEIFGLIGPNGAGKSASLVRTARFAQPIGAAFFTR
jgi:ABC-2 type transport system ATP-binding protein